MRMKWIKICTAGTMASLSNELSDLHSWRHTWSWSFASASGDSQGHLHASWEWTGLTLIPGPLLEWKNPVTASACLPGHTMHHSHKHVYWMFCCLSRVWSAFTGTSLCPHDLGALMSFPHASSHNPGHNFITLKNKKQRKEKLALVSWFVIHFRWSDFLGE